MRLPIHPTPVGIGMKARQAVAVDPPDTQSRVATAASRTIRRATVTADNSDSLRTGTSNDNNSSQDDSSSSPALKWWQTLCIALGGVLFIAIAIWAWWRHRRKNRADKQREKELVEEEEKRSKELEKLRRRKMRKEVEESDSDSEDYDSLSDGGTIRPRRRKKVKPRRRDGGRRRGRKKKGRRRGWSESESESEDESESGGFSDETYYSRNRRERDRGGRRKEEPRRRRTDDYDYSRRDRTGDRSRDRDRDYRRRPPSPSPPPRRKYTRSPSPSPTPSPVLPPPPSKKKETSFRDSVFSSYTSLKKAAVRLKYVEAKVKLKKQLDEEEALEQKRQAKVREANAQIEKEKAMERRLYDRQTGTTQTEESAASDQPLLIPPVRRAGTARSSSFSSDTYATRLPTPPARARTRQGSGTPLRQQTQQPSQPRRPSLPRQQPVRPSQPVPQQTANLSSEIHNLLGAPVKQASAPAPSQSKAPPARKPSNAFVADWLAHPNQGFSGPATATGSVYLPVTKPSQRPMIPKGGLAPAPPPKQKKSSAGPPSAGSSPGEGGVGGKWANRLRERR